MVDATWAGSGRDVSVAALRAGIAAHGTTVEDLLVTVGGPLRDLPAQRRQRCSDRESERTEGLAALVGLLGVPVGQEYRQVVEDVLWRWVVAGHQPRERADEMTAVVAALPRKGSSRRLAVVAVEATGDAHALDRSRGLGRAVARFLAIRAWADDDARPSSDQAVDPPDPLANAESWRAVWASAGVACDTVSARVLVLNLPLAGTASAVALCAAAPGEPVWLSLRSVTGDLSLARPTDVFVCENPTILEAASDRLGAGARPLICTFGRPDAAAMTLLRAIAPHARLHVRADGDAVGWGIVGGLLADLPGATRWRMPDDCTAYEEELLDDLLGDLGVE